jgi:predicted transcriptional regulator
MATKIQTSNSELESWAKKFGVSTLFDYDKFENREFIKRLDEARPIYEEAKKQQIIKGQENLIHDFR